MNITVEKRCDKKRASRFFVISFVIITMLWGLSFTNLITPGFWQALSVVYFCAATFYGIKFHMTEYVYTLTSTDFYITKTTGRKTVKVCHIDNTMLVSVCSKKEWVENKNNRQITSVYNYNASASPEEYCVLVFEMDSKMTAVMFEGSCEMKNAMANIIRGLKENQ